MEKLSQSVAPHPRDSQYYEVAKEGSLAGRLMRYARSEIFRDFERFCSPSISDEIVDVGVSDTIQGGDNMIERMLPHPERITASGLGAGSEFSKFFPTVNYVQITSGTELPFQNRQFTVATSNAVIEHLGEIDEQRRFVCELVRVARKVFISIPNRYFPIEHHTALPLLAWSDLTFRWGCRIVGKSKWAERVNLILMTRNSLIDLLPSSLPWRVGYTGLRLGPMSSNIFAYVDQGDAIF